ncbi:hypothetical protein [Owenweeksia hongkongensis]|uniref:hypothetical protein n=1 Tax=Owenweeksia hongkongensis TaxID=253245 RepID=UPI003A95CC02
MTDKAKQANKGLLYVIVLCMVGLLMTAYFLVVSLNEVKELTTHKDVLIRRLAEEVMAKKELQKEVDSLKKILEVDKIQPISSDVQTIVKP